MAEKKSFSYRCYRVIRWLVKAFYPKITVEGTENLPEEPCLVVGNHAQIHGPIGCELYFPGERYIWCAGEMMHREDVPAYAFEDFWSRKPRCTHWFYHALSHLIAPLSVCIFNNARTIGVYHDARILSTFRQTVARLEEGASVVVFPERNETCNHILYAFQDRFIDIAKLYYRRTGKELWFTPLYTAPSLKKLVLGKPIRFDHTQPVEQERQRICAYLMTEITAIAQALPEHTVIPYKNIGKKNYPTNRVGEK